MRTKCETSESLVRRLQTGVCDFDGDYTDLIEVGSVTLKKAANTKTADSTVKQNGKGFNCLKGVYENSIYRATRS